MISLLINSYLNLLRKTQTFTQSGGQSLNTINLKKGFLINLLLLAILLLPLTNKMSDFKKTPKQIEAINLIANNTTTLLEGGGRSGKTVIAIRTEIVRALHFPNTWHIALRLRFNHAKNSLWLKTVPDVLRLMDIRGLARQNNSDYYLAFPNGSKLLVAGLDDKERVEKILGNEYATIFINEAHQITFESYETVRTRLNPPKGIPARCLLDYNPPSKKHWGYGIFHERKFPDGRPVPDDDYAHILMNPCDNIENISDEYLGQLDQLSGRKRDRFKDGLYGEEEGSLWKRDWFKYASMPADLERVAIGVDPSGSKTGAECGIIAAGKKAGKYYVIEDYSLQGTPHEWGTEVGFAYDNNKADIVAAEKNYGGEMVESTINLSGQKNINVKLVNATRGKAVRAEPISAMYERGDVYHVKQFPTLEDELCTTKFDDLKASPNRLDALVWALTELSGADGELNIRWV